MSRRTDRLGDLLRQELSRIVLEKVQDPRVRLTTVTSVDVTPDLKRADVQVSVMGTEEERTEAVEALDHAKGFLRSELARRLRNLRVTPDLHFELDRGAEYSQRISNLLEELHDDEDERP